MERPGWRGGGMAIPARHECLINTVAPKAYFQVERLMFIFLRFQAQGNNSGGYVNIHCQTHLPK
jgi:hypothetical protein